MTEKCLLSSQCERNLSDEHRTLVTKTMCHSKGISDRFYVAELSVGEAHLARAAPKSAMGIGDT